MGPNRPQQTPNHDACAFINRSAAGSFTLGTQPDRRARRSRHVSGVACGPQVPMGRSRDMAPGTSAGSCVNVSKAPDFIVTSRSHPIPAGVSVAKFPVGRTGVMCAAPPPGWSWWHPLRFVFCETASVASAHPQRADSNTSCCIHCGRHRHTGNPLLCHDCNGVRDHE